MSWVTLSSGQRVFRPDRPTDTDVPASVGSGLDPQPTLTSTGASTAYPLTLSSGCRAFAVTPPSSIPQLPSPPVGHPAVTSMRPEFAGYASVLAWSAALAVEARLAVASNRPPMAAPAAAGAWSFAAAVRDVRDVIAWRQLSTKKAHQYATVAFAGWIESWPEVHHQAASAGAIEDLLCVYSLARRHATTSAPTPWPKRLGKRSLRSHTMAIRGTIRTAFALPADYKFAAHSQCLARLGCDDPPPTRIFTFPSELVQAWREALASGDLMQISWAATAIIWSAYRLRSEYWHSLMTPMFDFARRDMIVFDWDRGDKSRPLRPFEAAAERANRVTAADHPVLREATALWFALLRDWECEIVCPVVQPLRYAGAQPAGARIVVYAHRSWCVWTSVRRSCHWFGVVLRATASRLGWPEPDRRQPYGIRGGANLEARIRGVAKVIRHAQCWWSLRFMGAQLAYEPPTLTEMAAATRAHWASTAFDVVRGVPVPRAAVDAAAAAPNPAPVGESSSSSSSELSPAPLSRAAAAANRRAAAAARQQQAAAALQQAGAAAAAAAAATAAAARSCTAPRANIDELLDGTFDPDDVF